MNQAYALRWERTGLWTGRFEQLPIYTDAGVKSLFRHILEKDKSGAKAIVKEQLVPNDDEELGRYMATRGIVSMLDNKNIDDGIFEDAEKMSRLRKLLLKRVGSIWCDEFDKGYFDTWIRFINYSRRYNSGRTDGKEGVYKNPREQKEHNKAP